MVKTLDKLDELKETGFGQPDPRHGRRLLWWFAKTCVHIDSNSRMTALCNPTDSGFKRFNNRNEGNSGRLLPYSHIPYYEVGNLKPPNSLPGYVKVNYTYRSDGSNKDRIIVSYDKNLKTFDKIYVTQHLGHSKYFDAKNTFCISQRLIKIIQGCGNLEEFLQETVDNQTPELSVQSDSFSDEETSDSRPFIRPSPSPQRPNYSRPREDRCLDCCCIL
ncbi:uncharacterized protein [Misgurnus anguillicaudatus]|uniref:uncharacterized protein n=1 Tax=Misgurnus anguillicaudatus TaxID=75329 RepID=UPI003CCF4F32